MKTRTLNKTRQPKPLHPSCRPAMERLDAALRKNTAVPGEDLRKIDRARIALFGYLPC
jgi:hypothetical protein